MNIIRDEHKSKSPKGKGFYITLSICCAAVIAAGWSTYRSVKDFSGTTSKSDTKKQSSKSNKEEISQNIKDENDIPDFNKDQYVIDNEEYSNDQTIDDEDDVQSVISDKTDTLVVYPTNNNVIKEFSDGKPVYSKTLGDWRVHDGIDFKADRGSKVKSITGGTVKDIYNDPSYGTTVVIEHNLGFVGYYSGLGETTLVKKGDSVKAGDEIGSINDVPVEITEEPHLHLMINKDGKFIDPILILDKESE